MGIFAGLTLSRAEISDLNVLWDAKMDPRTASVAINGERIRGLKIPDNTWKNPRWETGPPDLAQMYEEAGPKSVLIIRCQGHAMILSVKGLRME